MKQLTFIPLLIALAAASFGETITIHPLRIAGSLPPQYAELILDHIESRLIDQGSDTIITRSNLAAVLAEQGIAQNGLSDDSCALKAASLVGASSIITGTCASINATYIISLKIIEVASGRVTAAASARCPADPDGLFPLADSVLNRLVAPPYAAPADSNTVITTTVPLVVDTLAVDAELPEFIPQDAKVSQRALSIGAIAVVAGCMTLVFVTTLFSNNH